MSTTKKVFTSPRILIVLAFVLLAILAISPQPWTEGAAIRNVLPNSSAAIAGIHNPDANAAPTSRERIISINNQPVTNVDDYNTIISTLQPNTTISIKTNKQIYLLRTQYTTEIITLNETRTIITTELINGTLVNNTRTVPKTRTNYLGLADIGLRVYPAPRNNLVQGLDLQGGTRVLLQPQQDVSQDNMDLLIESMRQRLNIYGLTDLTIRSAQDLPASLGGTGKQFIIVEIAGATEDDITALLAQQGKFEAKINTTTIFLGGKDITYVCRSADCSGIDPNTGCGSIAGGYGCGFFFAISLSQEAAQRQAQATSTLSTITNENGKQYLSSPLDLYLDNKLVDTLNIDAGLKGSASKEISISGSGTGTTLQEAQTNALQEMKRLQTILISGSLPVELDIVKVDRISPKLSGEFVNSLLLVGIISILSVLAILYIRYRRTIIAIPVLVTMASEVILILGTASLFGTNLDLAAIAGILIAVGTGVDDQIVIADETLKKKDDQYTTLKEKIKKAFSIILVSYLTVCASLIPLIFFGAGLVRGFAITTIIGITFGVFVTRPAFGELMRILLEKD